MKEQSENDKLKIIDFPKDDSIQAQAARWLAALDVDQPTKKTLYAFKTWVNADKRHQIEFESITAFWDELNVLTRVNPPRASFPQNKRVGMVQLPIFASIAVIFLLVLSFLYLPRFSEPPIDTYVTAVGEHKIIELPDNSIVYLNTDTQMIVDFTDTHRGIRLERGEALFDVAHDKSKPFEVLAADHLVRAVGTAFSVHLRPDNIEVLVTEGVVEIDRPVKASDPALSSSDNVKIKAYREEKVRIKAGNKALFNHNPDSEVLVAELKRIDDKVSWRTGVLTFDREPLGEVLKELSRYTTAKFIVPDKDVREIIVGGVFKVGDTESLFEALQLGFGIHAHEMENNVVSFSRTQVEPH